jgi:hypothetical protein
MIITADPVFGDEDIATFQCRLGALAARRSAELHDRLRVVQEYLRDQWLAPDRRVRLRVEQATIQRLLDDRRPLERS